MKFNENKEIQIPWKEAKQHFIEINSKVKSITFTIERIEDLGKISSLFEGRRIDWWEIGVGKKRGSRHEPTMVLSFRLKAKEVDLILNWLHTERPQVTWGLMEIWGDPLVYWKQDDKKLYRFYWLGQKIGKLKVSSLAGQVQKPTGKIKEKRNKK